ncbi:MULTISPECIES: GNAT family N-acetyltransferase [Thermoactinomyces]|uniref:GNAT family N-acetyltransferase n=1 Tax=Thermoactinomyces daqus TaxID=1329516 RepID=A0A7W1X7Q8_9BACL|nr:MULTISPECIES: GNAT family N-acetyltransferase [Thermoactinomyces]MBA4541613.1 GNAT family N-acetyltransferase [Thermoactinomyces daqus]MBH8597609.1 GNAT family N-acetyltransferase [Thermoactinomyces sp. CICC 10523]MBH8603950.1 GNAT family N-acetyltransferase [Thermoactinomyces sp. CICC 10522]MBH8606516.1 GNAT family N-acetyltransferase [Thermoactinomyces sp. CICC 10521]
MIIRQFEPQDIETAKVPVIRFMKRYGDGRITHRALRWFQRLSKQNIPEGTYVAAALDKKKLIGVIVFGHYGLQESFIAVHPQYRKRGVGEVLLKSALAKLPKIYTRVACDNIPSLKLCFSCGLIAFKLIKGPTGKPTLWLAGGDYSTEDVIRMEYIAKISPRAEEKRSGS